MSCYEECDWWETRWSCPKCGRFLPESAIQSETYVDPSQYFGIGDRVWADCARCGRVDDPRCIPTVRHTDLELRLP